jgi:hypothetical protein
MTDAPNDDQAERASLRERILAVTMLIGAAIGAVSVL